MNAFEKIKERLEEETYDMEICEEQLDANSPYFIDVPYKMVKLEDALSIVSEVEAEYGNGWIPCSERLPENDDDVLVWYEYLKLQGVNIVGRAKTHGIGYYYKPTNSWLIGDVHGLNNRVIAWMPLPEPYKPEKGA